MEKLAWVCLAGALGCGTRYLVAAWAADRFASAFPYATLIVNLAGCFLMALVASIALANPTFSPTLRLALTTGFMGGLTTYSSFNFETTRLLQDGNWTVALLNIGLTTMGCFLAGLAGLALGHALVGSPS